MTIYDKYYQVRKSLEELKIQEQSLKDEILKEIKDITVPIKTDKATFIKVVTKKYSFGLDVKEKEVEIYKTIKELTEPLTKKIDEIKKPLETELEEFKQKQIDDGKVPLIEDVNFRFSFNK